MRRARSGLSLQMACQRQENFSRWVNGHSTQSEVARTMGCSRQYVSWLMKHPMGYETARRIEERCRVPAMMFERIPYGAESETRG